MTVLKSKNFTGGNLAQCEASRGIFLLHSSIPNQYGVGLIACIKILILCRQNFLTPKIAFRQPASLSCVQTLACVGRIVQGSFGLMVKLRKHGMFTLRCFNISYNNLFHAKQLFWMKYWGLVQIRQNHRKTLFENIVDGQVWF